MIKKSTIKYILTSIVAGAFMLSCSSEYENLKPRLVVLTDIGDCKVEPDDMESAVRLLCYADMYEIEAIMTTTGWNCDPYPEEWREYLDKVVDAYETDVQNLMKRSEQTMFKLESAEGGKQELGYWPSADYIRSRIKSGSHRAGIGVIGKDNDSEGSEFLIKLADEDDERPIWVAAWGGANTLAQAIWKVKQTRTEEELKAFVRKFRLYTITDQDMVYGMRENLSYSSHQWLRKEFGEELKFIWDEGTWQLQCEMGKQYWELHQRHIQGKGELGKIYPDYKWGVEGDTPSFLYAMPNGLSDPEDPEQAGWGGCHKYGMAPDSITKAWTSWEEPQKSITEGYKTRFYLDELYDFMGRIQWASEGHGNTNPIVYINGQHSPKPIDIGAKAGETLTLDASMSIDAEGDKLSFIWWPQIEAGTYNEVIRLYGYRENKIDVTIPKNASGKTIHIVCEVHDDGDYKLAGYQRVIIHVD